MCALTFICGYIVGLVGLFLWCAYQLRDKEFEPESIIDRIRHEVKMDRYDRQLTFSFLFSLVWPITLLAIILTRLYFYLEKKLKKVL